MLDVASGQTKIIGNDPWMVPSRTLNPVWSPDSKWVAYSSRLKSLYHAIFVANVETGETKQVTDGLADCGLACLGCERQISVVLRVHRFRVEIAVAGYDLLRSRRRISGCTWRCCKKGEPSPLLARKRRGPGRRQRRRWRSGGGGRGRGGRGAAAAAEGDQGEAALRRAPRTPVNVQIDFDGIQPAHPRCAGCSGTSIYASLHAGVAGTVYYLEAGGRGGNGGGGGRRRRRHAAAVSPERSPRRTVRHRRSRLYR